MSESNPLRAFFEEDCSDLLASGASKPVSTVEQADAKTPQSAGDVVLVGCIDWEEATTSKNPKGLDIPHRLQFPCQVISTFSSASSTFFFTLLSDGSLYAMGKNNHGQLGVGDTETKNIPIQVATSHFTSSIRKVATGKSHTVILLSNGSVYGMGCNASGQLGLGEGVRASANTLTPTLLPLEDICDISCGGEFTVACDKSGKLVAFGHPENGQVGHGSDGVYYREGGKGSRVAYNFVSAPRQLVTFISKDNQNKVTNITAEDVKFISVCCGSNHSVALAEDGRVFSWGFGGYGRLGHNSGDNELIPREVMTFNNAGNNQQRKICDIACGASCSLFVSQSRHLYYCGKLANSPRDEATTRPTMQQELYNYPATSVSAGKNCIFVASANALIAWGVCIGGRFGFEGGAKSSRVPMMIDVLPNITTLQVSCGYGHVALLVTPDTEDAKKFLMEMPIFATATATTSTSSTGKRTKTSTTKGSVKRSKK